MIAYNGLSTFLWLDKWLLTPLSAMFSHTYTRTPYMNKVLVATIWQNSLLSNLRNRLTNLLLESWTVCYCCCKTSKTWIDQTNGPSHMGFHSWPRMHAAPLLQKNHLICTMLLSGHLKFRSRSRFLPGFYFATG